MKAKKLLALLLIIISCIFAFVGCKSSAIIDRLELFGVDTQLLNDYEIVCDIKDKTFTGRAPCYGIIAFKSEPTAFLQSFSTDKTDGFSSQKSEKLEYEVDSHTSFLDIPDEYLPNWNDEYIWYVSGGIDKRYYLDTLFLVYFPNKHELMVLETGH